MIRTLTGTNGKTGSVASYFDAVVAYPIDIETIDAALHSRCSAN
jgi:hypothetical protein